jgi:hypothetical protein
MAQFNCVLKVHESLARAWADSEVRTNGESALLTVKYFLLRTVGSNTFNLLDN